MSKKKQTEKDRHLARIKDTELHKAGACYIGHTGKKYSPCDYPWNGYRISKNRDSMYNDKVSLVGQWREKKLDWFKKRAKEEIEHIRKCKTGFAKLAVGTQLSLLKLLSSLNWADKFNARIEKPYKKLKVDPRAWNIGYEEPTLLNFIPRDHDYDYPQQKRCLGKGADNPYYHNHHHLIPGGVILKCIGPQDTEAKPDDPDKRFDLLLTSKWNINKGENIVILPTEKFIGNQIDLPTHCPYGQRKHPTYSKTCETDVNIVRSRLQEALDKGLHKLAKDDAKAVRQQMRQLSKRLLRQIRRMGAGVSISTRNS